MIKINNNLSNKTALIQAVISAKRYSSRIERLLAILVVIILTFTLISYYEMYSMKFRKVSFYTFFVPVRDNAVVDYAVTGVWPSENTPINENYRQYKRIRYKHTSSEAGNFVMHYETGIENNTFSEAYRLVNTGQLEPTIYWVCGYSQARHDEVITESNITNVPDEQLFYNCRRKRNSL